MLIEYSHKFFRRIVKLDGRMHKTVDKIQRFPHTPVITLYFIVGGKCDELFYVTFPEIIV